MDDIFLGSEYENSFRRLAHSASNAGLKTKKAIEVEYETSYVWRDAGCIYDSLIASGLN